MTEGEASDTIYIIDRIRFTASIVLMCSLGAHSLKDDSENISLLYDPYASALQASVHRRGRGQSKAGQHHVHRDVR